MMGNVIVLKALLENTAVGDILLGLLIMTFQFYKKRGNFPFTLPNFTIISFIFIISFMLFNVYFIHKLNYTTLKSKCGAYFWGELQ